LEDLVLQTQLCVLADSKKLLLHFSIFVNKHGRKGCWPGSL